MPRRLITRNWYFRHKNLIGYLILVAGIIVALAGVYQTNRDNQQRIIHQACISAKETRTPLIRYLSSTLRLSDKVRAAHLLPPAPPALRALQAESLQNLRTLTRVFKEKQARPCPPAP
jgi:hypothetical protein